MTDRVKLSRERIVEAAAAVADRGGLGAVSMRNVGKELGVEAMSLYHHIPNKDALLDALSEWVFSQIALARVEDPWRAAMEARADSTRSVLGRHSWALGMMESRPMPGPAMMRHHDHVLGCLLHAGFSPALAMHTFSALDAYIFGFVLTEVSLPFSEGGEQEFVATFEISPEEYPHNARVMNELVVDTEFSFGDEFAVGLEIILNEVERRLERSRR